MTYFFFDLGSAIATWILTSFKFVTLFIIVTEKVHYMVISGLKKFMRYIKRELYLFSFKALSSGYKQKENMNEKLK